MYAPNVTRLSHTVMHLKCIWKHTPTRRLTEVYTKLHMEIDTDEKLDNVTSVPLISDVRRTFEIQFRIYKYSREID